MLAAAILISTVLYLVDKNHQWKNFWRVGGTLAVLTALIVGGILLDDRYEAKKHASAQIDFVPYEGH